MSNRHLLVCDDEPEICTLVRRVASPMGFTVREVTKSTSFAEAFAEAVPEMVVLDIVMPERDGIEIVHWLAEQNYVGKVILISGYDPNYAQTAQTLAKCHGLTVVGILRKPVPLAKLREALAA
jgi:CheY-like chemotaxis protein